jgi:hypothetical protein
MGLKILFDNDGSNLAVPPSPPGQGNTPADVSIVGYSKLHNQYSNIGDPNISSPAYTNFGAGTIGYSNPQTSIFGLASNAYQAPSNRYQNNAPLGSHF